MEKVMGFGGFFFRSEAPAVLAQWYLEHLGVDLVPQDSATAPWIATGGPTVFAPFPTDTDYFARNKAFMINFRVGNLDAMQRQLEAAGIAVERLDDMPGIGRFAHLSDPEGNAIELWEPAT